MAITKHLGFTTTVMAMVVLLFRAEADASQLEEITVTAAKRVESVQEIPMSIQVVAGKAIQVRGIDNLDQLMGLLFLIFKHVHHLLQIKHYGQ